VVEVVQHQDQHLQEMVYLVVQVEVVQDILDNLMEQEVQVTLLQ
jgi:hypothetical protein